jgi:hypothetical protein
MATLTVYTWDEMLCEVNCWPMDDDPALTDLQLLELADGHVESSCSEPGDEGAMAVYGKRIRTTDGILVQEGWFGSHCHSRLYVCRTDSEKARSLAEREAAEHRGD